MKALLELQKQMEIDFLKEYSYEQINEMFRELKTKLNEAESKVKNLDIQRSELLISFTKWLNDNGMFYDRLEKFDCVDAYIEEINCG